MKYAMDMNTDKLGLWCDASAIPLQKIDVEVELALPIAVTRQKQEYLNILETNIEARYVFPVPFDAVLLGLEIQIGERTLHGIVKAKNTAEREYEQAIVQGDSAFLLTKLDEGMYQINLGNILPREAVCLTITWAETMRWNGQTIRYRLPNVIGQHYGSPQTAGIEPANAPTHSGMAAYELSFKAKLVGDLRQAAITSPSHLIETQTDTDATTIRLRQDEWLDRSLTLAMTMAAPPSLVAWSAPDQNALAVLGCLYIPTMTSEPKTHHLTLLIDGSGSMSGVPIQQARGAAQEIIRQLDDQDTCSVAAFGSDTTLLTPKPLLVGLHRAYLMNLCEQLDADLGGTEMLDALSSVMPVTPEGGDILMVTDGQLFTSQHDIERIVRHGRRLFTVGVGHSTSEKVLRDLSEASGGFCELVSPNENMADHIVSHFRRIRAPRINPTVCWPESVQRQSVPSVFFAGDTASIAARLNVGTTSTLSVDVCGTTINTDIQSAQGLLSALLPRLVAARLMPADNIELARSEAVKYQLISEHTSMIAVLERDHGDSEMDLPEIFDVPQMDVMNSYFSSAASASLSMSSDNFLHYDRPAFCRSSTSEVPTSRADLLKTPAFLRRVSDDDTSDSDWLADINDLIKNGQQLEQMLVITELSKKWQHILQPLMSSWAEEVLVLAVLKIELDGVSILQLMKYRPLNKAVTKQRKMHSNFDAAFNVIQQLQVT